MNDIANGRRYLASASLLVAFLFLVAAQPGTCVPVPAGEAPDAGGGAADVGDPDDRDDPGDPCDPGDPPGEVEGYTLFAPIPSTAVYLMDDDGQLVHSWETGRSPGQAVYLLDDGSLLHTESTGGDVLAGGGAGGAVALYSWEGELLWSFDYTGDDYRGHHDVEMLPNGNVVLLAWALKSAAEAVAAGCDPALVTDEGLWAEHIVEFAPETGEIVWEWHVWDHLVQDRDPGAANYVSSVAEHPGKFDIDYRVGRSSADILHANSIDYDADRDLLLISLRTISEIWIVDHASGADGELLYRWGNPVVSGGGRDADRQLYAQHDAKWIDEGLPGAGNLLVFDNGDRRDRAWSRVVELELPAFDAATRSFARTADGAFGPDAPSWTYEADDPESFYADHVSGAQRLASGETQICDGTTGRIFRVDDLGTITWEFEYGAEMFRAEFYSTDHPAFRNRSLAPMGPVPTTERPGPPGGSGRPGAPGAPGA